MRITYTDDNKNNNNRLLLLIGYISMKIIKSVLSKVGMKIYKQ